MPPGSPPPPPPPPGSLPREAWSMAGDGERLLRSLQELSEEELRTFAFYLGSALHPRGKLDRLSPVALAELLLRCQPQEALELAAGALEKVPRRDLLPFLRGQGQGQGALQGRSPRARRDPAAEGEGEGERGTAPAEATVQAKRVSDSELMKLARKMGKGWRQIGIEYLGIENSVLEQIEEENPNNVTMRAYYMLRNWKNREKEGATAARLYHILHQEEVQLDCDAYAFLLQSA